MGWLLMPLKLDMPNSTAVAAPNGGVHARLPLLLQPVEPDVECDIADRHGSGSFRL